MSISLQAFNVFYIFYVNFKEDMTFPIDSD